MKDKNYEMIFKEGEDLNDYPDQSQASKSGR
jgi:hypothetical protein